MAEIRVQPKPRSLVWLWVLLALAVVALVAWYLTRQGLVQVRPVPDAPTAPAPAATAPAASPAPATSTPRS